MSTDSSDSKKGEGQGRQAAHPSPERGLSFPELERSRFLRRSVPLKGRGGLLGDGRSWGILGGVFFGFVALLGPWFVLAPVLEAVLPFLPIDTNLKLALVDTILIAASFVLVWLVVITYSKSLRDIGFTKITWKHAGLAAGAFVLYFLLSAAFSAAASHFFPYDQNQPQEIGYSSLNSVDVIAAFVPLVILTPLAEESIFRGFMFTGFRRRLPFWLAAIGVSALFGLVHGQWNVGLDVFTMSMVSCFLREQTKSLWPSIFLHAIKNGVAFYLLYLYNGH